MIRLRRFNNGKSRGYNISGTTAIGGQLQPAILGLRARLGRMWLFWTPMTGGFPLRSNGKWNFSIAEIQGLRWFIVERFGCGLVGPKESCLGTRVKSSSAYWRET